jgi:hypothetical protein
MPNQKLVVPDIEMITPIVESTLQARVVVDDRPTYRSDIDSDKTVSQPPNSSISNRFRSKQIVVNQTTLRKHGQTFLNVEIPPLVTSVSQPVFVKVPAPVLLEEPKRSV